MNVKITHLKAGTKNKWLSHDYGRESLHVITLLGHTWIFTVKRTRHLSIRDIIWAFQYWRLLFPIDIFRFWYRDYNGYGVYRRVGFIHWLIYTARESELDKYYDR